MLREGLQVPVGGRRCLREAIVNLVSYPTALLLLDRDNPSEQAVQLALAFDKLVVEGVKVFLGALPLCDIADHHADDFPTVVKDHVPADFHLDQGAILAAMLPPTAYVPTLVQHASDVAVGIFPGVGDEVVKRKVWHFLGGVAEQALVGCVRIQDAFRADVYYQDALRGLLDHRPVALLKTLGLAGPFLSAAPSKPQHPDQRADKYAFQNKRDQRCGFHAETHK